MWTEQFDADAAQAPHLRHSAERFLRREGVTDQVGVIGLVLTELVSNAIRCAPAPLRATVGVAKRFVRVAVEDAGCAQPHVMPKDPTRLGGNGMRIVSSLAADWGINNRAGGKSVWAIVTR